MDFFFFFVQQMLTPGVAWVRLFNKSIPPNSFGKCKASPRKKEAYLLL